MNEAGGRPVPLRWRVGDVTITSISESDTPTSPRFLYRGVSKADVLARADAAGWLRPHFVTEEGFLRQRIHCCIIEAGPHRIAVDTCVGNDKQRSHPLWHQQQGPFLDDLADAGFPPETVTHVVCTHLHVDHVGWNTRLVDGEWAPTFPNAHYLFCRAEFDHWSQTEDLFGDDVFGDSVQPIVDAGLARMVAADHRICDEVSFWSTPGHTPGHVSVLIASRGKRAVITGDMVHSPLQLADPELSSMFDTDPEEARATRHRVFPDWADGETLLIGTHFGAPTGGIMERDGDAYRLRFDAVGSDRQRPG
ncbi:MBL fold metallo-hydrolase [Candidatus Poriferisodalis sp.]|uniref:MBL fold metallo-hydrolase n=1 Tax=Candidatus Poriferisodalis sp. TaxID=3101277 RepID=UPI003B027638